MKTGLTRLGVTSSQAGISFAAAFLVATSVVSRAEAQVNAIEPPFVPRTTWEPTGPASGSPAYMSQEFGVPAAITDCDRPQTEVTDSMSDFERKSAQRQNDSARSLCRMAWQRHQTERAADEELRQVAAMRASTYVPPKEEQEHDREASALLEQTLAAESRKDAHEACEVRAVNILQARLARGDRAGAQLEQDLIRNGSTCGASNWAGAPEDSPDATAQPTSPSLAPSAAAPGQEVQPSPWASYAILGSVILGLFGIGGLVAWRMNRPKETTDPKPEGT